jgi:LysM repeat protein
MKMYVRQCPPGTTRYTIKPGDTLYKIAQAHDTTVQVLLLLNPLVNPYLLMVGQMICVPKKAVQPPCPNGVYYTIKQGDTFYAIANQYNLTVEDLQKANPSVNPYNLMVGQVICIPKPPTQCPDGEIHVVNMGDTFYTIAVKYNVSYNTLVKANPDLDLDRLEVGQEVCVPPYKPSKICPDDRTYVIKEGDTLTSIAENFVVSASEILKYNPDMAPGEFTAGRLICLPPMAPV